jgi:hypothetical protein
MNTEKPFCISFFGGKSMDHFRQKARNSLAQLGCPYQEIKDLVLECYIVRKGRRFVPSDDYCSEPDDEIFFPRVAAMVSRLAAVTRLPPEGQQRDTQLAAEFNEWLKSGGLRRPGGR